MPLIDEEGQLFGTVNVVDALVVLLLVATVSAGAALVVNTDDGTGDSVDTSEPTRNTTVTLEIGATRQYVADAVREGTVGTNDTIVRVDEKSVEPTTTILQTDEGEFVEREHPRDRTVTLEVTLVTTERDGELLFGDRRVRVDESLTLELQQVTVEGTVTKIHDG